VSPPDITHVAASKHARNLRLIIAVRSIGFSCPRYAGPLDASYPLKRHAFVFAK
jgi:hypothetical protein